MTSAAPAHHGLRLETPFTPLGLHGGGFGDGVCDYARELREELLRFPDWSEMTTNSGVLYERQNGITTSPIQGLEPHELVHARRFHLALRDLAPRLYALVGARVGEKLAVYVNGMAYGEGCWLLRHTDENPQGMERLSFVLYLTPPEDGEWTAADGGALVLSDDAGRLARVYPRFNRLALFRNSPASWHEIEPVRRPTTWPTCRLALSGWLYS